MTPYDTGWIPALSLCRFFRVSYVIYVVWQQCLITGLIFKWYVTFLCGSWKYDRICQHFFVHFFVTAVCTTPVKSSKISHVEYPVGHMSYDECEMTNMTSTRHIFYNSWKCCQDQNYFFQICQLFLLPIVIWHHMKPPNISFTSIQCVICHMTDENLIIWRVALISKNTRHYFYDNWIRSQDLNTFLKYIKFCCFQ